MPDILFEIIDEDTTVDVVVDDSVISVGVVDDIVSVVTVEGPPGIRGLPGTGVPIMGETPAGVKDDVNTTFTTASAFVPNSTAVYYNGLRETRGLNYTETPPNTIVLTYSPSTLDSLTVDYIIA